MQDVDQANAGELLTVFGDDYPASIDAYLRTLLSDVDRMRVGVCGNETTWLGLLAAG